MVKRRKRVYQVFMIDPPWPHVRGGRKAIEDPEKWAKYPYEVLPYEEISNLLSNEILSMGDPSGHTAFVWMLERSLTRGTEMMLGLGYKMHVRMVWTKPNGFAPAYSVRFCHEYLVWFYKHRFQPVADDQRGMFKSWFTGAVRQHSRKPDSVYRMVDRMFPEARKLDVFSRENRNGWDCWGNETGKFG